MLTQFEVPYYYVRTVVLNYKSVYVRTLKLNLEEQKTNTNEDHPERSKTLFGAFTQQWNSASLPSPLPWLARIHSSQYVIHDFPSTNPSIFVHTAIDDPFIPQTQPALHDTHDLLQIPLSDLHAVLKLPCGGLMLLVPSGTDGNLEERLRLVLQGEVYC